MADALEDLFGVVHEAVVENRLQQLDVAEVALALPPLPAGGAGELHGVDPESQVVGPAMHGLVALVNARLGDLGHRPRLEFCLGEGAEPDEAHFCGLASGLLEQVA